MDKNKFIKENFGVSDDVLALVDAAEKKVAESFKRIDYFMVSKTGFKVESYNVLSGIRDHLHKCHLDFFLI